MKPLDFYNDKAVRSEMRKYYGKDVWGFVAGEVSQGVSAPTYRQVWINVRSVLRGQLRTEMGLR